MRFWDFVKAQWVNLPIIPTSCAGQTIIVTGANSGLGLEAAKHFVRLGASRVILAVRSASKGEAAKANIEKATKRMGVAQVWQLDLASYDSVKTFARRAEKELERIDVLMENAGIAFDTWNMAEGQEITIIVNVIGTFLLAFMLLPAMKASAKRWDTTPHLTILSSGVHVEAKFPEGQADDIFAALAKDTRKDTLQDRYQTSKLLEVYTVRALASRLPVSDTHVVINVLNPGLVYTELTQHVSFWLAFQIGVLRFFFARTAEMGSRTELHAAVAGAESHGRYLSECEIREYLLAPFVTNEKGKKMEEKVFDQLCMVLEGIEPGCTTKALQK